MVALARQQIDRARGSRGRDAAPACGRHAVHPFQNTPTSFRVLPGQRFFDVKQLGSADDLPRDGKPPALGRRQTAQRCAPRILQPHGGQRGVGHAPCARHPLEQTQVSGRIHSVVKAFVRTHEANAAPASGQLRAQRRAKLRRTLEVHGTAAAFQQQFPGCVRQRRTAFHVSFPPRSVPKTLCRRRRPFCRPRPAPSKIQPSCAAFGRSWRAASRR